MPKTKLVSSDYPNLNTIIVMCFYVVNYDDVIYCDFLFEEICYQLVATMASY